MNTKARIVLIIALALLAGAALVAVTRAAPRNAPLAPGGAPTVVAYQGEVQVGGTPYTGNGYFKFAVVNATGITYWSNDGTSTGGSEPTAAVQLAVNEGLFSVLLGDTTLGGDDAGADGGRLQPVHPLPAGVVQQRQYHL
jgi:hypothetical protein